MIMEKAYLKTLYDPLKIQTTLQNPGVLIFEKYSHQTLNKPTWNDRPWD